MSDLSFDVISLILAVAALIPLGYRGIYRRLPLKKFKELKKEFDETLDYFHAVLEEGLLPDPNFVTMCKGHLDRVHREVEALRADAYDGVTFKEQCVALYNGLSHSIEDKRQELISLHATIVSTSEKHRQELEERKRRLGNRSIFGVRKHSEIGPFRDLYYGEFDISLPNQPPSIHNDIAISRVASVRRHSALVAETVDKQPFGIDKLFQDDEQRSAVTFSEPTPVCSSKLPITDKPEFVPIKADICTASSGSPLVDTSSAAKAHKHFSTTSSSRSADTLTPFDHEAAAALTSQLLTIRQQLIDVSQQVQQVQERLGASSMKQ
ncbi:hypothetical protein K474DRAFT_1674577 [Panus rudis PR-1116 ss-1]|nr:hypothetical protein K474DRAFT_1674577 [Panus rudis PR-1116 ss-1]